MDQEKAGSSFSVGVRGCDRGSKRQSGSASSIDLSNLIENYDQSTRSESASTVSLFYSLKTSDYPEIDALSTATFYSAVEEGFSLRSLDPRTGQTELTSSPTLLWQECEPGERDIMLPKQDFQLYWDDITLQIKPKIDFNYVQAKFGELCNSLNISNLIKIGHHANYDVSKLGVKREPITLLNSISGSLKSGELTALIGPSGAGKTSLINFLSRRREAGYTGQYFVNDSRKRINVVTLPQNDSLPEYLTVRENLLFASRLKNGHLDIDHEKYTEKIAGLLGLDVCLDTMTRNISGGEQKRLAIAQELLSKPDVLILDEPTSGLDSSSCYKTLCVLKELVRASSEKLIDPIAILLSIHQPQQEAFELFDKIYVMAPGGIAIYEGSPIGCAQFVQECTGIEMPSIDYNPASFFIEVASGEYGKEPIDILGRKLKENFADHLKTSLSTDNSSNDISNGRSKGDSRSALWRKMNLTNQNGIISKGNSQESNQRNLQVDSRISKGTPSDEENFWFKTRVLFDRCCLSNFRNHRYMIARIMFFIMTPIFTGAMMNLDSGTVHACPRYFPIISLRDIAKNDSYLMDERVQDEIIQAMETLSLFFMTIYGMAITIIGSMAATFAIDVKRSMQEFHNGWYSMSSYLIARNIAEIPLHIILPTIANVLALTITGQSVENGLSNFQRFLIINTGIVLVSLISQLLGMIVGALFIGDITTALFVSQAVLMPLISVSGFVSRPKNMPSLLRSMCYGSYMKHALDISAIGRYGFGACPCDPSRITCDEPAMVDVPNKLQSFIEYWGMNEEEPTETSIVSTNKTSPDLFQLFAKQVFLYNTRGVDIKSCRDMRAYVLAISSLDDEDIYIAFGAMSAYLIIGVIGLIVTVKLVMKYKTSL